MRKLYFQAFYFRIVYVLAFTFFTQFYFGGGDTALYFQAIKDLRTALSDNGDNFYYIATTYKLTIDNPLAPFFLYDNYAYDITVNYMYSTSNFFIPRLGLIPSLLFSNSYLCISLCFSFFAMGGAIRLFKTFYHYYPNLRKELAFAVLFLPSVGFWSSGLLKDSICFGCVGFIVYAAFNIFIRKRKIASSLFWLIICGFLVFTIKVYIFLVLVLAILIWIFAETNSLIKDKTLRRIFAFLTFSSAALLGFFLLKYFTSAETLSQYQFENMVSSAENQRKNYEMVDHYATKATSYYNANSTNPVLLILNGIIATFFRPFIWEASSGAAVLSAGEALGFALLTIRIFFKGGLVKVFRAIFKEPRTVFCFVFAMLFAVGVGASTANFGALSRYKIPCMPFYMIMIIILYNQMKIPYPAWFRWILHLKKKR